MGSEKYQGDKTGILLGGENMLEFLFVLAVSIAIIGFDGLEFEIKVAKIQYSCKINSFREILEKHKN